MTPFTSETASAAARKGGSRRPKPRGPGAPPKRESRASAHLHIRVTKQRKGAWEQAAQRSGSSLSDWATNTLDTAASHDLPPHPQRAHL